MAAVTLYTRRGCPHSQRVRLILRRHVIAFDDIDVTDDPQRREEMRVRASGATDTPQVFIRGEHIGGADELLDLDERGALEWMVEGGAMNEASPT
ncbi:MAG: glutaredoxin [Myxococcaceae bacterium]|nr:glutaredoxin [Myxococcaceae bacterium]MCI0670597.1 glutaredoxin [Myxococcaceae bacterium]